MEVSHDIIRMCRISCVLTGQLMSSYTGVQSVRDLQTYRLKGKVFISARISFVSDLLSNSGTQKQSRFHVVVSTRQRTMP